MTSAFAEPSLDSARTFRRILTAMSQPGTIQDIACGPAPPAPLTPAMAALCLTLADMDAPLWVEKSLPRQARDWLRFHCGCPLVEDSGQAQLACVLKAETMPALAEFPQGLPEYPDRSATLFIQVAGLGQGPAVSLTGPGIKDRQILKVEGLPGWFWDKWQDNAAGFPLGVDVIFLAQGRVAGLPRSISAEVL
jgi:alpha-D-ribose 1-methylphosphonate 5-triphosphate synthase subunit PhnH